MSADSGSTSSWWYLKGRANYAPPEHGPAEVAAEEPEIEAV